MPLIKNISNKEISIYFYPHFKYDYPLIYSLET
jgi:hypothetical protein